MTAWPATSSTKTLVDQRSMRATLRLTASSMLEAFAPRAMIKLAFVTGQAIENRCTHNTVNLFIRVDGDKAWAEGYQIVLVKDREGDERRIVSMGLNHWTFEKHDGRWFIKERIRREAGGKEWPGEIVKSYLEA